VQDLVLERWAYVLTVVMFVIGLYGMLLKRNLVKKLIGMNIFQNSIILYYVAYAYKTGASVPIFDKYLGETAQAYMNPLPHGLMLTAIVVSVATTGVGLALLILIYRTYGTLEEPELLEKLRRDA